MSPTPWASAEQEAFLQTFYDQFVQCQAKRDYTTFWQPFFESWFAKFPERLVVFPNISVNTVLTEDQKVKVAKAVEARKDIRTTKLVQLRNTLGTKKKAQQAKGVDGKASGTLIADLLQSKEGRKRKPQKIEAYMSLYYEDKVRPTVDGAQTVGKDHAMAAAVSQGPQASKLAPTLATIMSKTREMFKMESPDVMAKVETKWKEMVAESEQKNERKDKQHYIDRLAPTLAQFLTGFQELTSWSFSVLMGGPLPENRGKIEACSLHIGMTDLGSTFDQAYPDFNNGIMRQYKDFLDRVPASMTGGTQEPAPKSELELAPPASLDILPPLLECGPVPVSHSTLTECNEFVFDALAPPPLTLDAPVIAATLDALPPMMPDDLLEIPPPPLTLDAPAIATTSDALPPMMPDDLLEIPLPPLTPDAPVIATTPGALSSIIPDGLLMIAAPPDTYSYNHRPQTAMDPLDQFLAKYPPKPLLQPHPSFPAGTGNKLAVFKQIVAAASATASTQISSPACNNTTAPQTNTTSAAPSIPSTLSEPPPLQPQLPVDFPPALVSTEGTSGVPTMTVASTVQVIDTAIRQNDTTVAASAPPALSDMPTLQPQLPLAPSQQNGSPQATQSEAIIPRSIQTVSSTQSSPVQPSPIDATSISMEGNGKRTRQPSKRNQVANSIGTAVGAPNKRSAANGTVKTRGAKKWRMK